MWFIPTVMMITVVRRGKNYSIVKEYLEGDGTRYAVMNNKTNRVLRWRYWASTGFVEDRFYKMEIASGVDPDFICEKHGPSWWVGGPHGGIHCQTCLGDAVTIAYAKMNGRKNFAKPKFWEKLEKDRQRKRKHLRVVKCEEAVGPH